MAWPVNARTSAMLDAAQALCPVTIIPVKGSPVPAGGGSAFTHSGEGAIDVFGSDLPAINAAMRQVGFASFERGIEGDGFSPHVHGIAIGEPLLYNPDATDQVAAYLAGRNGLRNNLPDSGPRDWVGITWETYSGGTYVPPSGGVPVIIYNQFPGDRAGSYGDFPTAIISGTPSFTGGDSFYLNDIDDPPSVTLHLDAGDSCFLAILEDWAYYQQEEALAAGYYLIRATGTGTLAVADAWDAYAYPSVSPTWVPQVSRGTVGGFEYFTASPSLLDVSHLYNDGWPLIRLTATGGSLDITWAGMQIQPASGFYAADAGFQWSANQPPSTTEPAMDGTGTYDSYVDGSDNKWTVDDSLVRQIGAYDAWNGAGTSLVDAQGARDASLADFGPWTFLNQTGASADLIHSPAGFLGAFEQWDATLAEKVSTFSAPTRAVRPSEPPGFFAIPEYLRQGPTGFEWFGDDCGLIGWHIHDGNVGFTGDEDIFTLYLTAVDSGFDPSTEWFTSDGVVVLEQTMGDVDPVIDVEELTAIPDTFYTSTAQLIARRLTLAREQTNQMSFWTPENGYTAGISGTTVAVDEDNVVRARFRIPGWRYKQPTFISVPGPPPVIDFDEDESVTWLRQRQRNDGLGNSVVRARGSSSRQRSLRQRGYR